MHPSPFGWRPAAFAVASLGIVACIGETPEPVSEPESVEAPPTYDEDIIVEDQAPLVTIGEFFGEFDPSTGQMTFETVMFDEYMVVDSLEGPDGTLRQISQPLWCPVRVSRTVGIELNTVADSVLDTPDACGYNGAVYPYLEGGMVCATVSLVSHFPDTLSNVYAQITFVSTAGAEGYRYFPGEDCCGNGANPALLPEGPGKPSDLLGLFEYGTVASEVDERRQWTFGNPEVPFTFRGNIVATFTEVCDGEDNDCDGRRDEGASCYLDGSPCLSGIDCATGVCSDGRCGLSTVVGSNIVPVGGAGTASSAGHSLTIRVGAPSPMGTAAAAGGSSVRLGPAVTP